MDEITTRRGTATSLGMPAFPEIAGRAVTNPPGTPAAENPKPLMP